MVKLYLNDAEDSNGKHLVKYVDINIWSLVKAYFLANLLLGGILFVVFFILGLISTFIEILIR